MEFEICDLGEVSISASVENDKYILKVNTFSGTTDIAISEETYYSLKKDFENKN